MRFHIISLFPETIEKYLSTSILGRAKAQKLFSVDYFDPRKFTDDVKIKRTVDEMGVLISLDVNAEDMGKVIGRSGNTAKAIRTLLRVVGMKHNARANLKINEPQGGLRPEATVKSLDQAMADLDL